MMPIPTTDQYKIHAFWGPRRETPQELAARFLDLVDRLSSIDPMLAHWFWTHEDEATDFDEIRHRLPAAIEATVSRADDGDPTPIYGYYSRIINSTERAPRSIEAFVHAGAHSMSSF